MKMVVIVLRLLDVRIANMNVPMVHVYLLHGNVMYIGVIVLIVVMKLIPHYKLNVLHALTFIHFVSESVE